MTTEIPELTEECRKIKRLRDDLALELAGLEAKVEATKILIKATDRYWVQRGCDKQTTEEPPTEEPEPANDEEQYQAARIILARARK